MVSCHYERDCGQEKCVTDFLNSHFFPYITKKYKAVVEVVEDSSRQLQGVDVIFSYKNATVYVDVKAQMNKYIAHPSKTFCLEISSLKGQDYKEGWYRRTDFLTTTYAFGWIHEAEYVDTGKSRLLTSSDDIKKMELIFVRKDSIRSFFDRVGLGEDKIEEVQRYLRKENVRRAFYNLQTRRISLNECENALTFVMSPELPECPINLVVSKGIWLNLCDAHYFITHSAVGICKEGGKKVRKVS